MATRTRLPLTLYEVQRGDLTISVTESGTIKSLDSTSIRSRVEGSNKIKWLIPEGTIIDPEETEIVDEDTGEITREGRLLVTLDSSTLESKVEDQEVSVNDAKSSCRQAEIDLEIQQKENESEIEADNLDVKFKKMDLEKYLGTTLTDQVLDEYFATDGGSVLGQRPRIRQGRWPSACWKSTLRKAKKTIGEEADGKTGDGADEEKPAGAKDGAADEKSGNTAEGDSAESEESDSDEGDVPCLRSHAGNPQPAIRYRPGRPGSKTCAQHPGVDQQAPGQGLCYQGTRPRRTLCR